MQKCGYTEVLERCELLVTVLDRNMSNSTLTEADIEGSSLAGRDPSNLKVDELKFWLKCRGDPAKGLKTKAQLVKR